MSLSWLSGTRLKGGSALGVVLIGGAVLLGACSSNSNNNTTTTSSTSTTSSTGSSTSSSAAGSGSSGSTTSSTPSSGSTGSTGGATGGTGTTVPSGGTGGAAALQQITNKLKSGENASFDAKYKVSGSGQVATIEVAAQPPSSFAFIVGETSGSKEDLFGTSTGAVACQGSPSSSAWTCVSLPASGLATYSQITDFYTGKYWYHTLAGLEAAAAASGATTSSMTVAGQQALCVMYGAASGGTVCVTSDGVLAYVKDNATGGTFELQSVSSSPAASLFQPPPGASVSSIPGA